jgi:hypothetical protein
LKAVEGEKSQPCAKDSESLVRDSQLRAGPVFSRRKIFG